MTPRRSLVALVALVVAASVAATAHGLYAVAVTSGVPEQVAVLYPLITDGLALVAYWATKQLPSVLYAWFVTVFAAGLSGLAQAVNLAGFGESPAWLRFGVGYWPAVAALLSAHLYWLVKRPRDGLASAGSVGATGEEVTNAGGSGGRTPAPGSSAPDKADGQGDDQADDLDGEFEALIEAIRSNGHGGTKTEKAIALIDAYDSAGRTRPSISRLAKLTGCSTGTAQIALTRTRGE